MSKKPKMVTARRMRIEILRFKRIAKKFVNTESVETLGVTGDRELGHALYHLRAIDS